MAFDRTINFKVIMISTFYASINSNKVQWEKIFITAPQLLDDIVCCLKIICSKVYSVHLLQFVSVGLKGPPGKSIGLFVQKRCRSQDSTDDDDDDWCPPVSKSQKPRRKYLKMTI